MEEESPMVRRAKSALLMLIFVAIVIFPMFQERKDFFEDRVGDPEVQLLPNTDKMQITLFPTKGQYGTGYYSILPDPKNATRFRIMMGNFQGALSQGAISVSPEGYNRLIIQGNDIEAGGYLEGYLTLAKFKQFYSYLKQVVLRSVFEDQKLLNKLETYYQQVFSDLMKKTNGSTNAYDQAINRSLKRLAGICRGFNDHVSNSAKIDVSELFMINSLHEMITLSSQKYFNKTIHATAGSAEHAAFLFAQNFGSTFIMKLSSQYIQHVHTMYTAIPTKYRLSKYYYHTAGKTDESQETNREISVVSYPGMIIGMDSFNAIKSSIMYTVNPLNSMIRQEDGLEFPFMESTTAEPFFLTLAAASAVAKNGKEMAELISQHKGDKLGYYSVTIVDVTSLREKFDSTAKDVVLLLEKAKDHIATEDITQKLIANRLMVSDGVAVDDNVRQQSMIEKNSLNGVFDSEKFATGAKNAYTLSGLALATKSSFNQDLIKSAVDGNNLFGVELDYIEEGLTTRL